MRRPNRMVLFIPALLLAGFTAFSVGEKKLMSKLSGGMEVPGPGDADGTATATLVMKADSAQVCFDIALTNVDDPTAAHIHTGAKGVAGDVVVTLTEDITKMAKDCAKAEKELVEKIIAKPGDYYVNVHSKAHPEGAVRGQLAPASGEVSSDR